MNLDKQLLPQDFQIILACSFLRFSLCFHIASPCSYTSARTCPAPRIMALDLNFIDGFNREVGEQDAGLTFEEACAHVQGQKIIGPWSKPLKCDRPADADIVLLDLPLRNTVENGCKLEQFADLILNHPVEVTQDFLDNTLYKLCATNFEIFQNHSVSNLSPMCPTASKSLSDQPSDRQIKKRSTSTSWSTSTCAGTRSFRKIFWPTVMAMRSDSTGASKFEQDSWPSTTCLTAWGACKFGSGQ